MDVIIINRTDTGSLALCDFQLRGIVENSHCNDFFLQKNVKTFKRSLLLRKYKILIELTVLVPNYSWNTNA